MRFLLSVMVFILAAVTMKVSSDNLPPPSTLSDKDREVLLMPNGEAVKFMSFGYSNAFADILWFKTINYFGKHYKADRSYPWLYHMCDLVSLNTHASWAYEFCGMMLPWEGGRADQGIAILSKAIKNDPTNWKYFYQRGFLHLFFTKDETKAKEDLVKASELPGAHPIVMRIAAKKLAMLDNPETAVEFLEDMMNGVDDPSARRAIGDRIAEIQRGKFNKKQ